MMSIVLLIAASALGVEAGWEPLAEGGYEYTVQVEPSLIARLQDGHDLLSEIPPQVDVRRLRITIGTGELARIDAPPPDTQTQPPAAAPADAVADAPSKSPGEPTPAAVPPGAPPGADQPADRMTGPEIPANFSQDGAKAQPLADRASEAPAEPQPHNTEKPRLDAASPIPGISEPWVPFVIALALLACSIGLNAYLGLVARSARSRYLNLVARSRPASA